MENIFINNYELTNKIGSGSFGEVFIIKNKKDKKMYAAKIEETKNKNRLKSEYNIYKKVNKNNEITGIPNVYNFIETEEYNIMIMELLGPSLESIYENCGRKFSLNTMFKLSIDIFSLIEQFHKRGFIHRDIKPGNFIFNFKKPYNKIYIMDFGLSKPFIIDGEHIEPKYDRSLIGTARYCSQNIHWGFEPSRRDDLESICYILIYLLRGNLPWQGLKKDKNKTQVERIADKKNTISIEVLCKDLPECLHKILDYIKKLKFEEKPNYKFILDCVNENISKLNIKPEYDFIFNE